MAKQENNHADENYSAEYVANAFKRQYYSVLQNSPDTAYNFYKDSSVLSHEDLNGVVTSVTTMAAIYQKMQSLDYKNCMAEIKTTDAQESCEKGVIVLVTGCLSRQESVPRKFSQTFFLEPQEVTEPHKTVSYFVRNDILRYVQENVAELNSTSVSDTAATLTSDPDNDEDSVFREELLDDPPTHSSQKDTNTVISLSSSEAQVQKEHSTAKPSPERETLPCDSTNSDECVEGHSIYVGNLPLNATVAQLEELFGKFGPIHPGGVQVKIRQRQGVCFGFVEFKSLDSMQSALKESAKIGTRRLAVEKKKSTVFVRVTESEVGTSGRDLSPSGRRGNRGCDFSGPRSSPRRHRINYQ